MDTYFKSTETRWCLLFSSSHPNHCKKNILFTLARRICTIVENQQQKLRHLSQLKESLEKYDYPINIITSGIKKPLEIPQNELRKPKEEQKDDVLPFISTFNSNNVPVINAIKNSVEVLKRNSVPGFESIKFYRTVMDKVGEHMRVCGRGSFKIFPFLQMRSNDKNLARAHETKFQTEYRTKLNQL